MNKEFLHMQKLAGLITESQYKKLLEDMSVVDRILDKISAQGKDSLTPEEKEYLDKYSRGEKNIPEPLKKYSSNVTKIYVSNEDQERFKIENFPALPSSEDIEFDCPDIEDEEGWEDAQKFIKCETDPNYNKLLQIKDFKNILEAIINFSYKEKRTLYNAFHGLIFYGDFSSPQSLVNIQFSGDGYLYIMDNENFGTEDEEHFGLKTWKEL